ncbi:sushi, von Willebrand factor type A, EGF and pentraxin domain containing 1, mRNA protein, partial [Elysia marginata]
MLAGRNFDRLQNLAKAVNSELRTIPEEDYQGVFRKWQIRLKLFRCPKLSPPMHGYFVNNKCNNVFNAACGLRCEHGYELRGSSLRMCRDDGTWTGTDATCIMKTCPSLSPPKNGHMVCSSDDFSYSTTCRFTCNAGYKLVNSRKRNCLAISEWTGIPPRCIGITCPPLVEIRDGKIRPRSCTSEEAIFGSTCHISCSGGYTLQGPHTRQCSPDGIWVASEEGSNKCVDKQAPLLNCPEDMVVEADEFQETTQVVWTAPVAVDNSGLRPVMTSEPAVSPASRLPQGLTSIRYLAEDLSQNVATCHFTINVVDKTPPRIDSCVSPPTVVSAHDGVAVNFTMPAFSDNSGRSVEVAASHNPGDIFYYGRTSVVFQAFDMWNNNVTCTIEVELVPHLCLPPEAPVNGNVTCEEGEAAVYCRVTCLPGYASVLPPADTYVCVYSAGIWEPAELFPFPDCAVKQKSSDVMQPATITLEGDVNCQETQVLYQVKQLLEDKVESELANVCDNEISCSLESLQILCEEEQDVISSQSGETSRKAQRQRRSVQEQTTPQLTYDNIRSTSKKSRLSLKVMLEGQLPAGNSTESDVSRNLQKVLNSLLEEARQGLINLTVHGKDLDFTDLDYDPEQRLLRCPNGSVAVNQSCVNCPVGTFYNATSANCLACPKGTFQPEEGQSDCVLCPSGTSTVNPHAKSEQECKARCLSGAFSSTGLEPCESCSLGFYQPEESGAACLQCNPGTTTSRRGCRNAEDCAAPCPRGHVSETGLAPCFRCPHHSYQPDTGQSQCLLCPPGLVTASSGAETVESCLAPSVVFGNQSAHEDDSDKMMVRDERVLNFDACFSQPCQNEGQCVPRNSGALFVCTCPSGFTGSQCEQTVDLCELEPCLNNGQCLQENGTFTCDCEEGFTGRKCEINIDECASSPCQNSAECVDGIGTFKCLCPLGFSGLTCSDLTNDCTQDTCRNGGTCTNTPAGFQCACAPGFSGTSCEIDEDECQAVPCQNEATCRDLPGSYKCECKQGFTGTNCETEVDECADSPCQNEARCENLIGSYRCHCPDGYSGEKCEKELSAQYQLDFVTPTIMEYAKLTISQSMRAMSVSVWFRTSDDQNQGTFFSYSVPGQPDTLTLTDYANLNMAINGKVARIGARLNDGEWHHFVFTWSSALGDWKAYGDGIVMDQNTDLSKGRSIPGQGVFIVGQEQDSLGGGFSPAETFVGSMTHLNIYDRILTLQEVEELRFKCDYSTGNVLSWMSVQEHLHGNIAPQPTSFCHECPEPVELQFGSSDYTSLKPGSYATFECNPGYELGGDDEMRCLASGNWEGVNPFCKLINCGHPGNVTNGQVLGRDFRYSKQVRYRCDDGFEISGVAILTCEEWGEWDEEAPTCQEIQCPLPALSENTIASSNEARFRRGTVVSFTCELGSVLHTAHDSVTCQRDGTWDKSIPSCDALHCGFPPRIDNGEPVNPRQEYNVGDSVRYKCSYGFDFSFDTTNNKKSIVCLPTGQWETELPECEPIKCLDPPSRPRATANGSGRMVGSVVAYTCNLGFTPMPARKTKIKCQANRQWTDTYFKCVPVPCPKPPTLPNGSLNPPNGPYLYKTKLLATCNLGYEVVPRDAEERSCEANRTWSGLTPSCQSVSCGQPKPVAKGTLTLSGGTKYLDTVTVTCDPGYLPEGPVVRTCEASKSWKPLEEITCVPRECPVPPDIDFGSYS